MSSDVSVPVLSKQHISTCMPNRKQMVYQYTLHRTMVLCCIPYLAMTRSVRQNSENKVIKIKYKHQTNMNGL